MSNAWWEYLVIHTTVNDQDQQDILNRHGCEGWELIGVSYEDRRLYLRRHRLKPQKETRR